MRQALLHRVAGLVPDARSDDCLLVGIDGVDGAGKTTFADELALVLASLERPVVRVSVDDFHHPRAHRHRRGPHSPSGFWADSFDYDRLRSDVLQPLGPGGSRRFRPRAHDVRTDLAVSTPYVDAAASAVVVVDGLFLQREELRGWWDMTVLLDVPFEVTAARMAVRDGSHPDPEHASMRRYVVAQRHYFATCDPRGRADVVVDNADPERPRVVRYRAN